MAPRGGGDGDGDPIVVFDLARRRRGGRRRAAACFAPRMHGLSRAKASCTKTEGCTRMCPIGQKHRGSCKVDGKMLKPDKMQTDEPKAGVDLVAHHVLGADRVLRQKKHPMEKFLEDAESSLNTPQPKAKKHKSTDASAKKQLASVKKELASVKKELALIKKENA